MRRNERFKVLLGFFDNAGEPIFLVDAVVKATNNIGINRHLTS
jgi:hypothetical protein